jgi:uncharacterized protein
MEIRVTPDLIMLSRGQDELLLANALNLKTLYIPRGRGYLQQFLKAVDRLGTVAAINATFPQDTHLLRMLMTHHLVEPVAGKPAMPPQDLVAMERTKRQRLKGMSVFLLLSQSCNLGCIYCLNGKISYQTGKNLKMREDVAHRSIERSLDRLAEGGRLEVVLFGGEPLLNWPLAQSTIRHCEAFRREKHPDKEVRYLLTSNLTFLPPDLIEWARKYRIGILCDVDGPPEIHDRLRPYKGGRPSHAVIAANIRRLSQAGLSVGLRATVTALNQDHLVDIARHHQEIGGVGSAFVPVCPINSDEEMLPDELIPDPDRVAAGMVQVLQSKIWKTPDIFPFAVFAAALVPGEHIVAACGAPYGTAAVVGVDGDVYPCIYLVGIKRFYLGNMLKNDYPDENLLDQLMANLHVDLLDDCRSCVWRYYCGGGCAIRRLTIRDNPKVTPKVADYCQKIYCEYMKRVLEVLLWEKAENAAQTWEQSLTATKPADGGSAVFC